MSGFQSGQALPGKYSCFELLCSRRGTKNVEKERGKEEIPGFQKGEIERAFRPNRKAFLGEE